MGLLVDGVWRDQWYDTSATGGRFERKPSVFRRAIGEPEFPAERGRYRLYVSLACPWAHRTLIFRALKGLEDAIAVSVVHWRMRENGWTFEPGPKVVPDPIFGARFLHQLYTAVDPKFSGRVTVPVLFCEKTRTIVNNESSEILRMLGTAFDGAFALAGDYYPAPLRPEIDALNARIYDSVNNGVYKAGFATTQAAYDEAVVPLFDTLDMLEARLADRPYLCGTSTTEADWRLFPTLIRFDAVYHGHFKCNLRRLVDYPRLWDYTKRLYHHPGVAETVDFQHIKGHYYESHPSINPSGVVPMGPVLDL